MRICHQIHLLRHDVGLLLAGVRWHLVWHGAFPRSTLRRITDIYITLSVRMVTHRQLLLHHLHLVLQLHLLLLLLLVLHALRPINLLLNRVRRFWPLPILRASHTVLLCHRHTVDNCAFSLIQMLSELGGRATQI